MEERVFCSKCMPSAKLKYYYQNTDAKKKPLLIYLHGAGSRGMELRDMGRVGPIGELDKGRQIPAVVVAPQCYADSWFDIFPALSEFIETMIETENIDKQRVYLCGVSMGGYASWQMAMSHPEWFAALVPVCGGGMYWNAGRLRELPIWAFHGALDETVLPEESVKMVKAVNKNGGNARITVYPHADHNAWDPAFAEDSMWKWMFEQKRSN